MPIWSDAYLNQLLVDAANDIADQTNCIFSREYLATTAGLSTYTLPDHVRGIKRITWRGLELTAVSWTDLVDMSPGLAYVSGGTRIEGTSSKPQFYALHPTNIHDIKFYPTPNETFSATGGDPYAPQTNEDRCCISCYRTVDTSDALFSLPAYIDRRTRKAYVLMKAFGKEGKGQNSTASKYYNTRYNFLVKMFAQINAGCFASIIYQMDDALPPMGRRPAKPVLPPNFERVRF